MTNVFSYKLFKDLSSHQLHSLTLDFFSCNFFFRYFIGELKGKCVPLPNAVGPCYKKSSLNKSQPREKNEITMNELKMKLQKAYGDPTTKWFKLHICLFHI